MTVLAVTADNLRLDDGEATTGYANIGGGAGTSSEASFAYQGSNLVNRKVTSATGAGFSYTYSNDGGAAVDMTATRRRTWMVKTMVSDYGGLDVTDGVLIRIGTDGSNYYAYVLAGTDSPAASFAAYRDIGGLLVIPVDPNESASYNDTGKDAGTPTLTSIDYFAIVDAFTTASAKNENVGLDAIDVGSGLYLVSGTGADPSGNYSDFADFDGGTVANRYGYARFGDGGTILAYGEWRIGTTDDSTSTATEFDGSGTVVWLDHQAGAGFSNLVFDYGHDDSVLVDRGNHRGAGDSTNVDSRPDLTAVKYGAGTGSLLLSGIYLNLRNVTLLSDSDMDGALIECELLTQAAAEIQNTEIRTNSLTSVACIQDPTFGVSSGIHDVEFVQTGVGHALEIVAAATLTFTNIIFDTAYGADTTDSAALDVTASSGTVTINIEGTGTTPTYKTAGATVTILNTKTFTIVDLVAGTEVRIIRKSDNVELAGVESSGTTFAYAYNYVSDVDVKLIIQKVTHKWRRLDVTLGNADANFPAGQSVDPDYENN